MGIVGRPLAVIVQLTVLNSFSYICGCAKVGFIATLT
jgi:hypothetical protein